MTWLSRLLPQTPGFSRATTRDRIRQAKRRRRQSTLETLEGRVVLSNIGVAFSTTTGLATLTGDLGSHAFSVTENNGSMVIAATNSSTTINNAASFTINHQVNSLKINLSSSPITALTNTIQIGAAAGAPKMSTIAITSSAVGAHPACLNLDVSANLTGSGVNLYSAFNVSAGGALNANVSNDSFGSVSIIQTSTSTCSASVTMNNDNVTGNVTVTEGMAGGDTITMTGDNFGVTNLTQGGGNGDLVSVTKTNLRALNVNQGGGANDSITVDTVGVYSMVLPPNSGISTLQGNGNNDVTVVNRISTFGTPNNPNYPVSISVTQGSGNSDSATVSNANVTGNIGITQEATGTTNSGIADTATILNVNDGWNGYNGATTITQGDGGANTQSESDGTEVIPGYTTATIDNSGAPAGYQVGYAAITQGMGIGDVATIQTVNAVSGGLSITQGLAAATNALGGDQALIDSSTAVLGISITQGSGGPFVDTNEVTHFTTATISNSTSTGDDFDISITQGNGNGDIATLSSDTSAGGAWILQGTGSGDQATIDPTQADDAVSITQGNGNGDSATIQFVTVTTADVPEGEINGIAINQAGGGATALVDSSTAPGDISVMQGGGSVTVSSDSAGGNILVTQGDGSVAVSGSTAGGDISVDQTGNGNGDSVNVSGSTAGGDISITQGNGNTDSVAVSGSTAGGDISVDQTGNGNGDSVNVSGSTAGGDIWITQSNGNTDSVTVTDDTAGSVVFNPPYYTETGGTVTITQGNGAGDQVVVGPGSVGNTFNNLNITQGNNGPNVGCCSGSIDSVTIDNTFVYSDINITQGSAPTFDSNGNLTGGSAGGYSVAIATDGATPVTAYGVTTIYQAGFGNVLMLGDQSGAGGSTFTTGSLNVFMGELGGAFASVASTTVLDGMGVIDAGLGVGTPFQGLVSNTYYDFLNNYGVNPTDNFEYVCMSC
ncbi:MAG: beta strand repeat-containing protein [Isosphaeraceae bacterium]